MRGPRARSVYRCSPALDAVFEPDPGLEQVATAVA
jgi:hypothetical protein